MFDIGNDMTFHGNSLDLYEANRLSSEIIFT